MSKNELIVMAEMKSKIEKMLQGRLANRIEASSAFDSGPLDNMPESVKQMRELQKAQNSAVMQELKDLISVLNLMYPDG